VQVSRNNPGSTLGMPQFVRLAGALGIDSFDTGTSPDVEARSSLGSVNLSVFAPQRLYIQAAQDIHTGGWIGQHVELVAGRDVLLDSIVAAGLVRVNAGRDFLLNGPSIVNSLSGTAGRDVKLPTGAGVLTWVSGPGGTLTLRDPASLGTVATISGLTLGAGQDILVPQPVHVGAAAELPTTLTAGRNILLGQLETMGDVTLASAAGHITVTFPLGAPVPVVPPDGSTWNPGSLGVNSLAISALGSGAIIDLQGARSVGNVSLIAPNNGTVNSAYSVTSSAGSVFVNAPHQNISATPIPLQARIVCCGIVSPAAPPGPLRAGPPGPDIPAAPAPGAPLLAEVPVSSPSAIDAGTLAAPGQAGVGADNAAEQAAAAARTSGAAGAGPGAGDADSGPAGPGIVIYTGGRGPAQSADLGRSGTYGSARAPQGEADDDKRQRRGAATRKR
jgi:hypothetical protein